MRRENQRLIKKVCCVAGVTQNSRELFAPNVRKNIERYKGEEMTPKVVKLRNIKPRKTIGRRKSTKVSVLDQLDIFDTEFEKALEHPKKYQAAAYVVRHYYLCFGEIRAIKDLRRLVESKLNWAPAHIDALMNSLTVEVEKSLEQYRRRLAP